MNTYKCHRFPPDINSYAVWLYYRFNLSHRDIEDLLAERGIIVTRESIRLWCIKFGAIYTRRLKRKHRRFRKYRQPPSTDREGFGTVKISAGFRLAVLLSGPGQAPENDLIIRFC